MKHARSLVMASPQAPALFTPTGLRTVQDAAGHPAVPTSKCSLNSDELSLLVGASISGSTRPVPWSRRYLGMKVVS
jgi:hypothetical protein